ncbi:MAG: non-canonical purine NTP diphosphatase [Flavobacteriales bacterium]|jgi:XTP/dITP diphosphohydrolase|nr:non-canonical purine NTP diphosphatase [Flavobacteriales bacterium]
MKLVFATNNENKIKEIKSALGNKFEILSLKDINCNEELPETQETLEGNALQKARYVSDNYNVNCFADDTGLIIAALNGEPGVYSARYAGEDRDPQKNIEKVLSKLGNNTDRAAYFETSIALIIDKEEYLFSGKAKGVITKKITGAKGFGYDPIFQPENLDRTFAELNMEEKNKISHRGKAFDKMCTFLLQK